MGIKTSGPIKSEIVDILYSCKLQDAGESSSEYKTDNHEVLCAFVVYNTSYGIKGHRPSYCSILLTWHRCIISRLVHKIFLPSVDFRYLP